MGDIRAASFAFSLAIPDLNQAASLFPLQLRQSSWRRSRWTSTLSMCLLMLLGRRGGAHCARRRAMAFTVATATSRAQSTRTSWRTYKLRRQKRTKLRPRKLQKLRNLQPDLQLKDVRSISSCPPSDE
jgi:hypothetical protein